MTFDHRSLSTGTGTLLCALWMPLASAQAIPAHVLDAMKASESALMSSSGTATLVHKRRADAKFFKTLPGDMRDRVVAPVDEKYRFDWLTDGSKFWTSQAVVHAPIGVLVPRSVRVKAWDGSRSYSYESYPTDPNGETVGSIGHAPNAWFVPFTAGYRVQYGGLSRYLNYIEAKYAGDTRHSLGKNEDLLVTGVDPGGFAVKAWLDGHHGYLARRIETRSASGGFVTTQACDVKRWERRGGVWVPVASSFCSKVSRDGAMVSDESWKLILNDCSVNAGRRFRLDVPNNVVLADDATQDRYKTDGSGGVKRIGRRQIPQEEPHDPGSTIRRGSPPGREPRVARWR